ncbi:hypothetical protein CISIN_1g0393802mg, partial [Citrus sinensis]
MVLSDCSVIGM